ncbi:glutathione S-transferase N-terminal domain-containing protein [Acuticoccus sp. M5D2P5]|uniref:glutathione S-transferase N-terminal domain-containing protein n=1 Tax=Acuticoccus kalidii TaxID=2910977 RepID=UPI001F207DEB|nr:glutathione S-transferase N-terminal domain-containing protein [Acuticoccus kalidii]MCF3932447.1 glutathione S-transferase N-terminal domain-containing protein [Acuticoccus kalidii]
MSIELYTWGTPNGKKVSIMLEEVGLPYNTHPINITKDEQFDPSFLAVAPNNKIPAIVDNDTGVQLMESGAILMYLAQKTGKLFAAEGEAHWRTVEWLMWQMAGFGPMLGQTHHFHHFNPGKADYAEERFLKETQRLYGVLDQRLDGREFIAGDYSIADIATWPWAARFGWHGIDLNAFPNVKRWYTTIAARDAVKRGYSVPTAQDIPMP